jgi:hypothetical protein
VRDNNLLLLLFQRENKIYCNEVSHAIPRCTLAVPAQYPCCTRAVLPLSLHRTIAAPSLYPRSTLAVPLLYPRYTRALLSPYPRCTIAVPPLYPRVLLANLGWMRDLEIWEVKNVER